MPSQQHTSLNPHIITGINWVGLATMIRKETERFLKVYLQTIIAPVINTLLFYFVFSVAFADRAHGMSGTSYMSFLLPGLVMMSMAQNAFANTSSSLVMGKIQGNIVDVLMSPLSAGELVCALALSGVLRGLAVGTLSLLIIVPFAHLPIAHLWAVLAFALLGSLMLALLGILGGLWAEKFDHLAGVTNFIIMPLTMLSGTFYSINALKPAFKSLAHLNPFFYMIDGFRFGFTGNADMPVGVGLAMIAALCVALWMAAWWLLKSGYKIKA